MLSKVFCYFFGAIVNQFSEYSYFLKISCSSLQCHIKKESQNCTTVKSGVKGSYHLVLSSIFSGDVTWGGLGLIVTKSMRI